MLLNLKQILLRSLVKSCRTKNSHNILISYNANDKDRLKIKEEYFINNNIKKISTLLLSSLGILASTPSAFCVKEAKAKGTTPLRFRMLNETKSDKPSSKPLLNEAKSLSKPPLKDRTLALQELGDLVSNRYLFFIPGKIIAPNATGIVRTHAFYGQSKITAISLPKIQGIEEYAFYGCENLKSLTLSNTLTHVDPKAFVGCNPNLIIYLNDSKYTIKEFLRTFPAN